MAEQLFAGLDTGSDDGLSSSLHPLFLSTPSLPYCFFLLNFIHIYLLLSFLSSFHFLFLSFSHSSSLLIVFSFSFINFHYLSFPLLSYCFFPLFPILCPFLLSFHIYFLFSFSFITFSSPTSLLSLSSSPHIISYLLSYPLFMSFSAINSISAKPTQTQSLR